MKNFCTYLLLMVLASCGGGKEQRVLTPWGDTVSTGGRGAAPTGSFDLDDIQSAGEMIALTVSGPDTYYDYGGRQLGPHFLLCQHFAEHLGVSLRVDVCRDSAEVVERLLAGEADLAALPLAAASSTDFTLIDSLGWGVPAEKPQLLSELSSWYAADRLLQARREEQNLLSAGKVRRRVYSPMMDGSKGIISRYDGLFVKYASALKWDWRLLAAQCYQESTFDPEATSWAGAKGLMQIMPTTADHLGLPRSEMTNPEKNIAAATRFIGQLDRAFADIQNPRERQRFVLASYNGGVNHIRDAMAICQRDGHDSHSWREVAAYVLKLSQPEYYQDPIVKYGYMRGTETVGYVDKIMERYQTYSKAKRTAADSTPSKARNKHHRDKYN